MQKCLCILLVLQLAACCEPAHIKLLLFCDANAVNLSDPPTCRNKTSTPFRNKPFSVSIDSYSIKDDKNVRFSLYDRTNNNSIIEEVNGPISDFGRRFTRTERCVSFLTYTFQLPRSGVWPRELLVEVAVTGKDTIYTLNEEFRPI